MQVSRKVSKRILPEKRCYIRPETQIRGENRVRIKDSGQAELYGITGAENKLQTEIHEERTTRSRINTGRECRGNNACKGKDIRRLKINLSKVQREKEKVKCNNTGKISGISISFCARYRFRNSTPRRISAFTLRQLVLKLFSKAEKAERNV